jgi:hypothetical protein
VKKRYRIVTIIFSLFLIVQISLGLGFWALISNEVSSELSPIGDRVSSQHELTKQALRSEQKTFQLTSEESPPEDHTAKKESDLECLTFEQFMNLDAASKTLFEKSANGLTMCRKTKDQQSANDALKSENKP